MVIAEPLLRPAPVREAYYSPNLRQRFQLDGSVLRPAFPAQSPPSGCKENFSYDVDEAASTARSKRRAMLPGLPKAVPVGFPKELRGPLVWKGKDFGDNEDCFVHQLTDADKIEIDAALEQFKGKQSRRLLSS